MHGYFDAPGVLCWAILGLSVAFGYQHRYVLTFTFAGGVAVEGETMMRHSETMRAASRLLLGHPIVCLLAALAAAVVVLGVLGPIKVVHAGTITPSATTSARLVGAGDIGSIGSADIATGNLIDARPNARVFTAG